MRLFLCLFLLLGAGVAVLILPDSILELPLQELSPWATRCWRASLSLVAVPLLLMSAVILRMRFVRGFTFGWGLWLCLLSFWILFDAQNSLPKVSWYGIAFVAMVMLAALGTVLSVVISALKPPAKEKAKAS